MDEAQMQKNFTDSFLALSAMARENQTDVAAVLGLTQSSVASKFAGKTRWTLGDLAKLSTHYGVTLDEVAAGPWSWLKAARQAPSGQSGVNGRYPDLGSAHLADALVAA